MRWPAIATVLIVLGGGIVTACSSPLAEQAPPPVVPSYHAMPRPALKSAVTASFTTRPGPAGDPGKPSLPFAQCLPAGRACGELIQVTGAGAASVDADPGTGPYDGSAATLIGVLNSTASAINSLAISSDTGIFAFAGDGACGGRFASFPAPRGCPYGATGYEGPGISFTGISNSGTAGTVKFAKPLAPGKSAWFSLAQALAATAVPGDAPAAAEQGGAPNVAEHQEACSPQPVNCATGAFWEQFTDVALPGRGVPLALTRTYVSADAGRSSPFGYGWTDDYSMRLRSGRGGTETVIQEDGAPVTFTPTASGGYSAPPDVIAWLAYNEQADTFTFSRYGSPVQYQFDPSQDGRLTGEADAAGNVTSVAYNDDGTLMKVTDEASGRALTFFWRNGYVWRVSGPLGYGESYGYDQHGNLTSVRDDAGDTWKLGYLHPDTHLLTSVEDPRGSTASRPSDYTTQVTYDKGRVSAVTEPGSGTTAWSYAGSAASAAGGVTTERNPGTDGKPDGAVTAYDYRALELTAVTLAAGTPDEETTGYTYTTGTGGRGGARAGLVATQTDPELNVTSYGYDQYGNLTSTTTPPGRVTRYAYQGDGGQWAEWGEVTQVTPPGSVTPSETYTYDQANGNLLTATDGVGNETRYQYNGPNNSDLAQIVGADGGSEQLGYDAAGDVTSEAVATGTGTDTTKLAYDADGDLTCEVPPASGAGCPAPGGRAQGTQDYGYNSAGERAWSSDPAGGVTTMTYDPDGDLYTLTTPDHDVTSYRYNPADEETKETAGVRGGGPPAVLTTLGYYANGLVSHQSAGPDSAADADVTTDSYDVLGRLQRVTTPLGVAASYAYGRDGELAKALTPAGQARYSYDAGGELASVSYSDPGTPAARYAYYPDGDLKTMTDGTGTTAYTYDGDGRLKSATRTGALASQYAYAYDDAADTVIVTYPNGQQVRDTYNVAGQLTEVKDWLGDTIAFSYAPGGAVNRETFPGGVTVTDNSLPGSGQAADGDTLTVAQDGTALASFTDHRAPDGLLSSVATSSPGVDGMADGAVSYRYNAAGQLKSAGTAQFSYSPAGGLLTTASGGAQQLNAAGELQSGHGASYGYDNLGDLTRAAPAGRAPERMSYNQLGELTGYENGTTTASYAYDGNGLRASKTADGATTGYTWDLSGAAPELLAAGTTSYIYGPGGQPVEQVSGGTPAFLIADQQGSTRLLTSQSGDVTGSYSYTPLGAAAYSCPDADSSSCATTALELGGQYTDAESGFVSLSDRLYDPVTAQYLTGSAPSAGNVLSPYAFAGDDPVNAAYTGMAWQPLASHPNPWNPANWTWKQWAIIGGGGLLLIGGAILTAGADLPAAGALAGAAAGADTAADTGVGALGIGAVDAAEATGAAGGDVLEGSGGILADDLAEGGGDLVPDGSPPGEAESACDTPACQDQPADGAGANADGAPPPKPKSCGRLSSKKSCLGLLIRAWVYFNAGKSVYQLGRNAYNTANTCTSQTQSAANCAKKSGDLASSGVGAYNNVRKI